MSGEGVCDACHLTRAVTSSRGKGGEAKVLCILNIPCTLLLYVYLCVCVCVEQHSPLYMQCNHDDGALAALGRADDDWNVCQPRAHTIE